MVYSIGNVIYMFGRAAYTWPKLHINQTQKTNTLHPQNRIKSRKGLRHIPLLIMYSFFTYDVQASAQIRGSCLGWRPALAVKTKLVTRQRSFGDDMNLSKLISEHKPWEARIKCGMLCCVRSPRQNSYLSVASYCRLSSVQDRHFAEVGQTSW